MKIIVGLGNPGREYGGTRHNVGFEVVDAVARRHRIVMKSRRDRALSGEGVIAGERVLLMKPMTFMNLSGEAVARVSRRCGVPASEVLVVCDDVNLPLGRLRIRASGSAGGQGGLKSIIRSLGTEDFPRLRIGIGSTRGDMVEHVLSRFHPAERAAVREAVDRAAEAVEASLSEGLESAMNRFNA